MSAFTTTLLALACMATGVYAVAVAATWHHTRIRRAGRTDRLPSVSLIKPIKGLEEALGENLRSFFEQSYPAPFEVVFSSTEPADPGIAVARQVAAEYPDIPSRFVTSDARAARNPKVANLKGAVKAARHDHLLLTDANVRADPTLLRDLVAEYTSHGADLMGALVAGTGEQSLGAALENVQLGAFITPLMCAAHHLVARVCLVGKALLLRRSQLDALGGLAVVGDVLAEDYLLGWHYRAAGLRVALSRQAVANVNVTCSVGHFVRRHRRWLQMRRSISTVGFAADLVINPLLFALAAWIASGVTPSWFPAIATLVALKVRSDTWLVGRTRGAPLSMRYCWLPLVRDLLHPLIWLSALTTRTTEWRGRRLRLGPRTRIRREASWSFGGT